MSPWLGFPPGRGALDIINKREGPRPEDVRAKRLISENAATIRKLADPISGGGYSAMQNRQKQEAPRPDGLILHDMGGAAKAQEPEPYVRISLNGRVVLACRRTGKQIQLLGEIRHGFPAGTFRIATAERGYLSPVADGMLGAIAELDGCEIGAAMPEDALAAELERRLGLG